MYCLTIEQGKQGESYGKKDVHPFLDDKELMEIFNEVIEFYKEDKYQFDSSIFTSDYNGGDEPSYLTITNGKNFIRFEVFCDFMVGLLSDLDVIENMQSVIGKT